MMPRKAEEQLKDTEPQEKAAVREIHDALEASVKRQLMSDVPYGVLLSGGLDSSVISAVARKYSSTRVENGGETKAYWPRLHSFRCWFEGCALIWQRHVWLPNTSELCITKSTTPFRKVWTAIRDVIYFIETYDVTTVRASTRCICWRE